VVSIKEFGKSEGKPTFSPYHPVDTRTNCKKRGPCTEKAVLSEKEDWKKAFPVREMVKRVIPVYPQEKTAHSHANGRTNETGEKSTRFSLTWSGHEEKKTISTRQARPRLKVEG